MRKHALALVALAATAAAGCVRLPTGVEQKKA